MNSKVLLAGILALACGGWTQLGAQSATPGAASPEGSTDVGKSANFDQLMNRQTGSMQFYGKVAMASGKLPWDPIPVVVNCDGKVRYNTVTDPKGGFYIVAAGRNSEVLTQKKDPGHADPAELVGCSVSATVEGYTSTRLNIANRTLEDDPSLGTIVLARDEHATGSIASPTTEAASPEAQKEFEKARSDDQDKHTSSAVHHLEKAVSLDPQFAEAWYHLGRLREAENQQEALTDYQKAAAADASYIPPYEPIAAISALEKKWQNVADATNQALKLDPAGTPEIWYFNAVGNFNLGNRKQAETSAETSLAMDPNHRAPNTEQLLAVILASRGDYAAALNHLRHCLTYMPPGPNANLIRQQVAQLEKIVPQTAKTETK